MEHGLCSAEGKLDTRTVETDLQNWKVMGLNVKIKCECGRPRIKSLKNHEEQEIVLGIAQRQN